MFTADNIPQIDIMRPDHGTICTVAINSDAVAKYELGKEDYIELPFVLADAIRFNVGDYVDLRGVEGIDWRIARKFVLVDSTDVKYSVTTGGFEYKLKLCAEYYAWKNKLFMYRPSTGCNETSWSLSGLLGIHLQAFVKNLKEHGFTYADGTDYDFVIDTTIDKITEAKAMTYTSVSLIDALTQMADTWECEWWVEDNHIHFGKREQGTIGYDEQTVWEIGKEAEDMSKQSSSGKFGNRLFVFGGQNNIPVTYRKELYFDVTHVMDTQNFRDAERPLSHKHFDESLVTYGGKNRIKFVSSVTGKKVEVKQYDNVFVLTTDKMAIEDGTYDFEASFLVQLKADEGVNYVDVTISFVSSKGREVLAEVLGDYVYAHRNDYQRYKRLTYPAKITLADAVDDAHIEIRYKFKRENDLHHRTYATLFFAGSATASKETQYGTVATTATFLSGQHKGETFKVTVNPDGTKDGIGIIHLNTPLRIAKGDHFNVAGLLEYAVPTNWWREPNDDIYNDGVVKRRLMLPKDTPYVDTYRYVDGRRVYIGTEGYEDGEPMPVAEVIETVVTQDDIWPKLGLSAGAVSYYEDKVKDENNDVMKNADGTDKTERFYYFPEAGGFVFNNKWIIKSGESKLQIKFTSGRLNGYTFDCTYHNAGSYVDNKKLDVPVFEVVANENYGRRLPDENACPQKDDTFVLVGWDTAQYDGGEMIAKAEQKLYEWAVRYAQRTACDDMTITAIMASAWVADNEKQRTFPIGQRVRLVNSAFFGIENRDSRIIGYKFPVDFPFDHIEYTVGESTAYSRLDSIENKIDEIAVGGSPFIGGSGGSGTSVYLITTNDTTAPSEGNTYSARRIDSQYLRNDRDEVLGGSLGVAGKLSVGGSAVIKENLTTGEVIAGGIRTAEFRQGREDGKGAALWSEDGVTFAEVDNLSVRSKAVFTTLEADEVRASYGDEIRSCACNRLIGVRKIYVYGQKGDVVYYTDADGNLVFDGDTLLSDGMPGLGDVIAYRCYFAASDGETEVVNRWVFGDFAYSKVADTREVGGEFRTRKYWRLVTGAGTEWMDATHKAHYVDLCNTEVTNPDGRSAMPGYYSEWNDVPRVGDTIAQLGHYKDTSRQWATAVFVSEGRIVVYDGINRFAPLSEFMQHSVGSDEVEVNASRLVLKTEGKRIKGTEIGVSYEIVPSVSVIRYDKAGKVKAGSMTWEIYRISGGVRSVADAAYGKVIYDGGTSTDFGRAKKYSWEDGGKAPKKLASQITGVGTVAEYVFGEVYDGEDGQDAPDIWEVRAEPSVIMLHTDDKGVVYGTDVQGVEQRIGDAVDLAQLQLYKNGAKEGASEAPVIKAIGTNCVAGTEDSEDCVAIKEMEYLTDGEGNVVMLADKFKVPYSNGSLSVTGIMYDKDDGEHSFDITIPVVVDISMAWSQQTLTNKQWKSEFEGLTSEGGAISELRSQIEQSATGITSKVEEKLLDYAKMDDVTDALKDYATNESLNDKTSVSAIGSIIEQMATRISLLVTEQLESYGIIIADNKIKLIAGQVGVYHASDTENPVMSFEPTGHGTAALNVYNSDHTIAYDLASDGSSLARFILKATQGGFKLVGYISTGMFANVFSGGADYYFSLSFPSSGIPALYQYTATRLANGEYLAAGECDGKYYTSTEVADDGLTPTDTATDNVVFIADVYDHQGYYSKPTGDGRYIKKYGTMRDMSVYRVANGVTSFLGVVTAIQSEGVMYDGVIYNWIGISFTEGISTPALTR